MTKSRFRSLMVTTCILVTLGLAALIARNYWQYEQALVELSDQEQELKDTRQEIAMIQSALERYEAEQKELEEYLFSDRDVPAFLDGISEFGKETGVNIFDMKTRKFQAVVLPDDVAGGQSAARRNARNKNDTKVSRDAQVKKILTLAAMPINIKVEGTFEGLVDFLGHLQSYRQLLSISKIEISAKNAEYPVLRCEFTLQIYSLKSLSELKET